MRAAVLHGVGQSVKVEDVPVPTLGAGEVVVRITAAALNHRDVWIKKGQYAGLKFPVVLGSDGVGTVVEATREEDSLLIGREVIINPALGWGTREEAQDSSTFNILGLPRDGTLAQHVAVPAESVIDKPPRMNAFEAAAMPLAGLTAYRAVAVRGAVAAREKVLVTGIGGGTAVFALQVAAALGADVYVTSSSDAKIERALELGAKGGANYRDDGWDRALAEQVGAFDLIVDSAVGENFSKLIELARPGGRIVVFGSTAGDPPTVNLRRIFWKQISLLGTTMGSPRDFSAMVRLLSEAGIKPLVDRVFPFADVDQAFDHMASGAQMGKIVIDVQG